MLTPRTTGMFKGVERAFEFHGLDTAYAFPRDMGSARCPGYAVSRYDPNHAVQPDRRARSHVGRPPVPLPLPRRMETCSYKDGDLFSLQGENIFPDRGSWELTGGVSA